MMRRPVSVTVFGVLNLLWGFLGLIMSVISLFTLQNPDNPMVRAMANNATITAWMKVSLILSGMLTISILISGAGLLCMKRWARILAMAYAVVAIFVAVIGGFMNLTLVFPAVFQEVAAGNPMPPAFAHVFAAIVSVIVFLVSIIYPVLLLIFMKRRNVIAAFQAGAGIVPPPLPASAR